MDSLKNSIIVAYDFTEVAMNAVAHAVYLAKNFNTGIPLSEGCVIVTQKLMHRDCILQRRKITVMISRGLHDCYPIVPQS